ncbi:MSMEG_0567/sll0787 family protein [Kribbella sp. NBC_00359]|uniref:MSMEG_0567/sll0787 family protein n=1 Tax=Kribbella sp. NBC_00359 TaxID=2975966 RepID=UPI002E1B8400
MSTTVVQTAGVMRAADVRALLGDPPPTFLIDEADDGARRAYHRLRHAAFVENQGLFDGTDLDERDADPRTVVLVARDPRGAVIGGVRLGPATDGPDIGWWQGGRLVTAARTKGVGAALVRAACARAEAAGALRFDATVQTSTFRFFQRLGWETVRSVTVASTPHVLMRWPIGRIARLVKATKSELGPLLQGIGPAGFVGDDGAPVPGSDLVAACDAILPAMVERDPEWAGWCSVLVNVNDLSAMGAEPVGLLDALGARDGSFASRVLGGLKRAAGAYGVPILGGHTQLGVPAALSVTALGRTAQPVAGGGGRLGQHIRLTADLAGGWRPGYAGRQWDSTSHRRPEELRTMLAAVGKAQPSAAKDVSMAGVVGTLGMLAEASGCAAVLDVADVPKPDPATMGDWLTCFPGFAMLTSGPQDLEAGPAVSAVCGQLTTGHGVGLRWPDGDVTEALTAGVTGMGAA